MGKIRRGGYIIVWWKGDHSPRHVPVKLSSSGKKLGVSILMQCADWKDGFPTAS